MIVSKERANTARLDLEARLVKRGIRASYGVMLDPKNSPNWAVAVVVAHNPENRRIPCSIDEVAVIDASAGLR
jgi:hypothetical protein